MSARKYNTPKTMKLIPAVIKVQEGVAWILDIPQRGLKSIPIAIQIPPNTKIQARDVF